MKYTIKYIFVLFFLIATVSPLYAQWVQAEGPFYDPFCHLSIDGENIFWVYSGDGSTILSTDNGTTWSSVGRVFPRAGIVFSLLVKGHNIYAGTGNGIFLSTNLGANWSHIDNGLPTSIIVNAIVANSDSTGDVFAGTSRGVFLSTNNGTNWISLNTGLSDTNVISLLVNGTNLFAGTFGGGVFISVNNGLSWNSINTGLTDTIVYCLASKDINLYAGTHSGVFRSTNHGASWTATGLAHTVIQALAIKDSILYAGSDNGLFFTTNHGSSWVDGRLSTNVFSLAIKDKNIFSATSSGIFLSTNDASSWTCLTGQSFDAQFDFARRDTNLFIGTNHGVFLSNDNGISWMPAGLPSSMVVSLAFKDSNLFAYTGGNVFLSTNNGVTWGAINAPMKQTPNPFYIYSLMVHNDNIYITTLDDSIFVSSDDGSHWAPFGVGVAEEPIQSLILDADSSNIFYARTNNYGVFKSTDYCSSWTAVNSGLPNALINVLTFSGKYLYAGTSTGVYRTTNNGASWISVSTGLTNKYICVFADDPAVPGKLFTGTYSGGVFLTTNNGSTWSNVSIGLPAWDIYALTVCGTNLVAGTNGSNVWYRPLSEIITDVNRAKSDISINFSLSQNYPNPFNPVTNISFSIPKRSFVSIKVYDLLGREVSTIISEEMPAGSYSQQWNATNMPSGVYFYRLHAGQFAETKKLVLLR
jgi:photosystem II stability/assembly factor-like uncharacterized protein